MHLSARLHATTGVLVNDCKRLSCVTTVDDHVQTVEWGLNMLTTGAFTLRQAERRAKQVQQQQMCMQLCRLLIRQKNASHVSMRQIRSDCKLNMEYCLYSGKARDLAVLRAAR